MTLDCVFIDYLQIIEPTDPRATRERQVAHISRRLLQLSKELNCAVVVGSQLNREGSGQPTLTNLRESGAIEQAADCAILMHCDNAILSGPREVAMEKNRNGPRGRCRLEFNGDHSRLSDELPEPIAKDAAKYPTLDSF